MASFKITRNHNQLQELIINLQPNTFSLTAEDSPSSHSRSCSLLLSLISFFVLLIVSRRIHRKHIRCPATDICEPYRKHLFCLQRVFISPLPSNGSTCYNIFWLVLYSRNTAIIMVIRRKYSTCQRKIRFNGRSRYSEKCHTLYLQNGIGEQ
jgi:hypothetical protein